jgi:AcrR family transcriptional regulator
MSTADRKLKEKEALRDLILQAARRLFVEKGIEQTTIRNIADSIDYSIGTVYVYFKDKAAILHALHSEGFTAMGERFVALHAVADPMERLRQMGRIYIRFAKENPDMYDLMFSMKAPMAYLEAINDAEWSEGQDTFGALKSTVQQCLEAGHFKGHQLEPLTFMIWSLVHGMCSLEIGHRTKGVDLEHPETIVDDAFASFLLILEKL